MKIEELINRGDPLFSVSDRSIADYMITHRQECQNAGCEELAAACHVSRATLLRFCRKLGLSSFSELKYVLKEVGPGAAPSPSELDLQFQNYHSLIDDMQNRDYREICMALHQAGTIYIYGTGNAQKAEAEELKRIFLSVGKCVIDLFDAGEVALCKSAFQKDDVFLIISLSGETPSGIEILRSIGHTPVKTLSITRWDSNTIARMCAFNLYVGTSTMQGYQTLSYELIGAFYVLLDILYVNYLDLTRGAASCGLKN